MELLGLQEVILGRGLRTMTMRLGVVAYGVPLSAYVLQNFAVAHPIVANAKKRRLSTVKIELLKYPRRHFGDWTVIKSEIDTGPDLAESYFRPTP